MTPRNPPGSPSKALAGATLVELIVSIVVIGVGLAGILVVIDRNTRASADPLLQHQAIAVAEAYLEEILTRQFSDPGGPGVESRATFDDVNDYNGLSNVGARDQNDNAISGLEQYTVGVSVTPQALGSGAAVVPAADSWLIQVTVTPPLGSSPVVLRGYRTRY